MTYLILLSFFLYVLLTSILPARSREKVTDRTKRMTEKISYTSKATGPDRASAIFHSVDAFNLRIEMIRAAEHSIDLVVDKIIDSESTRAILGELYEAAERGVKVNLMVNGLTYLLFRNQQYMKALNLHEHITCRIYNPVNLLKLSRLQIFLHDKICLIDETYLLLGSRNLDERHFRPAVYQKNYAYAADCFIVNERASKESKSVIYEVQKYVKELYAYKHTAILDKKENLDYLKEIKEARENYSKAYPHFYKKSLDTFIRETFPTNKITLLHNPANRRKKEPVLGYQLQHLAFKAKEELLVHTPHMTGNEAIKRAFKELSDRVPVTVQTNSAASTPNLFAFSNYYGNRNEIVQTGVNLYEFQSESSLHSNLVVVDNQLAAIGSFNLSDRSLYINSESMLVVSGEAFAAKLKADAEEYKHQSLEVGPDNDYIESDTVEEITVSFPKKILLFVNFYLLKGVQFFAQKKD